MWIDIYIRERDFSVSVDKSGVKASKFILLPWIPEKIQYDNGGGKFATYDILDKGEVAVPSGENLGKYSWDGIFPGKHRDNLNMLRGVYQDPSYYIKILEDWKKQGTPLRIVAVGLGINADVLLDEFNGEYVGGFSDFEYSLSFIEDKDIIVTSKNVSTGSKRSETQSSTKNYTIKKGDTLWEITERFLGSGMKWQSIYDLNKNVIEKDAKGRGYKSSDKGWWIFPGATLKLPRK